MTEYPCLTCGKLLAEHDKNDRFRCPGERFATFDNGRNEDGSLDTEYQDFPRCPHCGHDHLDVGDWFNDSFDADGDTTEAECDRCGESFKTELHLYYSFTTEKK